MLLNPARPGQHIRAGLRILPGYRTYQNNGLKNRKITLFFSFFFFCILLIAMFYLNSRRYISLFLRLDSLYRNLVSNCADIFETDSGPVTSLFSRRFAVNQMYKALSNKSNFDFLSAFLSEMF